eukprot:s1460_g13.t1
MKRHYQYSHSDILQALGGRVRTLIQRTATACPTCHFCHVQCKDWREHIMKCTVIYQCAVVCLVSQDGCRNGAGSVLRGCEAGGQCTQAKATTRGYRETRDYPRDQFQETPRRESSLVISLARQLVRQEEEIKVLRQDHVLIFFMKPGEHNMLLDRACQEEDFAQKEDKSRKPLTDQEVAGHLQKLTQLLLLPDLVHRFSCTKRLTDTMEGTATFMLDLSIRTPQSLEVWSSLLALQGCTVLQLGGIAHKREGFKPSPAIAKIKEMPVSGPTPRLVLLNRGRNLCYMNSLVQAWALAATTMPRSTEDDGVRPHFLPSFASSPYV